MSEREFQTYLDELCRKLNLSEDQRRAIASEFRDHLDARLNEVGEDDTDRDAVVREVLAEFGDPAQLATNLTHSQRSRQWLRIHPTRRKLVAIGTAAAVLLAVGVYHTGFNTPRPTLDPDEFDAQIHESQHNAPPAPVALSDVPPTLSGSVRPTEHGVIQPVNTKTADLIRLESIAFDAGPDTWTAIKQLGDIPDADDPSVAVLPGRVWPVAQRLPRTTVSSNSTIIMKSGSHTQFLSGQRDVERDTEGEIQAIYDNGYGLTLCGWWCGDDKTIELVVEVHSERSYEPETHSPLPRRKRMQNFPAVVESVTLRAQLQHGQILAHRTPIRFGDSPAANPHRVVLIRATHVERETQQAHVDPRLQPATPFPTPTLATAR